MNIKKLVLPLVALFAGSFAFAQMDGYEPDWNNPDEVGNVFVCLESTSTSDGEECVKGVWFTVDQIPIGNDDFVADPAQVAVLTELYAAYPEAYKVASYAKSGDNAVVSYKEILMYGVAPEAKLATNEFASCKFKKVDTEYGSFLTVLPETFYGIKSVVSVTEENGQVSVMCDGSTVTVIE